MLRLEIPCRHEFRSRSPPGGPAFVLRPPPARPPLARGVRPVPNPRLGSHAPADEGRHRGGVLRALARAVPGREGAGSRPRARRAQGVGGAGVLSPGPESPRCCAGGPGTVGGLGTVDQRGAPGASGRRRVHRRSRGQHSVRRGRAGRRRERAPGAFPLVRHTRSVCALAAQHRRRTGRRRASGRLEPGAHGARSDDLYAQERAV